MRSYYVIFEGCANLGYARRDYADFARAFRNYRACGPGEKARLYGVDRLDCSVLLGERIG